jgi:metal-responsive CopG/Arc/MetJ family transcriptional regulator
MARVSKVVNISLLPDVLRKLDGWIDKQPAPPSRSAVIAVALKKFLEENNRDPKARGE